MRLSKDYGYHFRGHHDKDNMSESYLGLYWGPLAVQTTSSMHVQFGRPPDFARVTSTGVRLRQKRKQTSYGMLKLRSRKASQKSRWKLCQEVTVALRIVIKFLITVAMVIARNSTNSKRNHYEQLWLLSASASLCSGSVPCNGWSMTQGPRLLRP